MQHFHFLIFFLPHRLNTINGLLNELEKLFRALKGVERVLILKYHSKLKGPLKFILEWIAQRAFFDNTLIVLQQNFHFNRFPTLMIVRKGNQLFYFKEKKLVETRCVVTITTGSVSDRHVFYKNVYDDM